MKEEKEKEIEKTEALRAMLEEATKKAEEEKREKERETEQEMEYLRAVNKKAKKEVDRLRRQHNDRENEWGEKMHTEMKRRGELLQAAQTKTKSLVKERDTTYEYSAEWKRRAEVAMKEVESLRATLVEDTKKAGEKLCVEEEEKKRLEVEVVAVRAELAQAEKKKEAEKEDVEMGGTEPPSRKTMVDAATNTEKTTMMYAQAAVQ